MKNYKTIKEPIISEFKVKKSKFIGYIVPVSKVEEAEEFVERIRKKHYDARHNVPVYLLGPDYKVQKYSDDGEPSKTAGYPILEMLKNEGITNIAVVVTRYFGGVKLGTGGLVRAYTKSVRLALDEASIVERKLYNKISFEIDYTLHGKLVNYIQNDIDIEIDEEVFTDKVKIKLFIKPEKFDKINKDLTNMTSGSISVNKDGEIYLSFIDGKLIK